MDKENKVCKKCGKEIQQINGQVFCAFCGNMIEHEGIDLRQSSAKDLEHYSVFWTHYRNAPFNIEKEKINYALNAVKLSFSFVLAKEIKKCIDSDEREAQFHYEENQKLARLMYEKEVRISELEDEVLRLEGAKDD